MAAEVETMFYVGEVPWHGLGRKIEEAPTSEDALVAAGLDWEVIKKPMGIEVSADTYKRAPVFANIRNTDEAFFGVVSDRYKIVQNKEAFAFTDILLQNDFGVPVTYETAGSLFGGRRVWMMAKLPVSNILGDAITPYLVITNTFDGKGSVKVAMTPTRVVCNNTLTLALGTAKRTWSTRHTGNIESKIKDAEDTLQLAQQYMNALTERAEIMQQTKIGQRDIDTILEELFPSMKPNADRANLNNRAAQGEILGIYDFKDDLKAFHGTQWGFYNAVADWESHVGPRKVAPTFQERKFVSFIDGSNKLSALETLLVA